MFSSRLLATRTPHRAAPARPLLSIFGYFNSYRGTLTSGDSRFVTASVQQKAFASTRPRGRNEVISCPVDGGEREHRYTQQPEERALRYHNYAAFLRRLASRTQAEMSRARLRTLADQFDQLADSIHLARVAA